MMLLLRLVLGGWTLSGVLLAGPQEGDLASAIRKSGLQKSLRFSIESSFIGMKGRRELVVEGIYEKDQPYGLKCGGWQAFRKGSRLLLKKGAQWVLDETASQPAGEIPVKTPPPLEAIREARLPQDEMPELLKSCKEWKAGEEKEDGQTVYLGEMSPEATRAFGAGHEGSANLAGSVRFWVGPEGIVSMYEVLVRGSSLNKQREERSARYVRLSEVGTATLEVPAGVRQALGLEQKP